MIAVLAFVTAGVLQPKALAASTPSVGSGADYVNSLVQVILTLLVIIGIIVLLIKFLAKKNRQWTGNRSLRIVSGVMLGQHKSMQVVEIGGALYIIGVGDNVTLLDRIDDPERAASMLAALDPEPAAAYFPSLETAIRRVLRFRAKSDSAGSAEPDFRELLQQKLTGIHNRKSSIRHWMEEEEETQRRSTES